jgi:hypothetical protein
MRPSCIVYLQLSLYNDDEGTKANKHTNGCIIMAEAGVVVDFATAPTATRLTITASIIANLLMLDVHYQEANHTQV